MIIYEYGEIMDVIIVSISVRQSRKRGATAPSTPVYTSLPMIHRR